jgi:hypothetical protein
MLYLITLIGVTLTANFLLNKMLKSKLLSNESRVSSLNIDYDTLLRENSRITEDNAALEKSVSDVIALYDITKAICKTLDEDKIFTIFNELIKNYLKVSNCQYLKKDVDLSLYPGYVVLPLIIQQEIIGYLVANDIDDKDKDAFQILGQQFLIAIKRALLYKRVQELSITDSLTQLYSRRHFLDRLKEELKRSKKFQ